MNPPLAVRDYIPVETPMKRSTYYPLMALSVVALTGFYAALLYGLAGRVDLPVYHAYLATIAVLTAFGMLGIDPGLMRERMKPGPDGRDARMIPISKLLLTMHLVIAPLDAGRMHWSTPMPLWLQAVGLVAFAAGLGFATRAMIVNRYFSSVVRLQEDRGHTLIDTGPYALVRHPGYAGIIVGVMGSGFALNSWWSIVPVAIFCLIIIRRLLIEDRFLHEHLEGYPEYAQRVRHRLIPGIW